MEQTLKTVKLLNWEQGYKRPLKITYLETMDAQFQYL